MEGERRGKGKAPWKVEWRIEMHKQGIVTAVQKEQILELMRSSTPENISLALDIPLSTTNKVIEEVVRGKIAAFEGKSVLDFTSRSFESYEAQMRESWKLYMIARDDKSRLIALEKVRQAQAAQDNLLKMAGIYVEKKEVTVTVEQIMNLQEMKDLMTLLIEFLTMKGIDPEAFFTYLDKRRDGRMNVIDVTPKGVATTKPTVPPFPYDDPLGEREGGGEE